MMYICMILGLLVSVEAEVILVFVQPGQDLLLDVQEPVTLKDGDDLTWTVNRSTIVLNPFHSHVPIYFGIYSERAELFRQNYSLLLKNVPKSDRGYYRACLTGKDGAVVAEYEIRVLDPVSPVNLTVKSCSSDSSNLTVTCSTQDSLLSRTFTCDDQSCSEERGERAEFTTPAASLEVYLKNDSIICVHSNQVSRTEDVRKIEDFCEKEPGTESFFDNISVCKVKILLISSGLIIMVCVVISVHITVKVKKRK